MEKIIKLVGISAAMVLAGSAHATTFQEAQNTSFTKQYIVTPNASNVLIFSLSGLTSSFADLSFSFVDVPNLSVNATVTGNNLVASFSDPRNKNFLLSNIGYKVTISGDTKAIIDGGQATVGFTALNATVAAVPEPESYAMLLAGLGLMGAIARRRNSKQA